MREKMIQIKDLTFGYSKDLLIDHLNLDVYRDDFIGITGPNGCGKSTLLKLILGELKPLKGTITYCKEPIQEQKLKHNIGYVPQSNLVDHISFPITCKEIVSLNCDRRLSRHQRLQQIKNTLRMVNLEDRLHYNFNDMSGGEMQRVMIAKALVANPDILIFDEPTAGIDKESKELLFQLLTHLNQKHHITIFVVTHEMEFSKKYFNKIYELKDCKLERIDHV